MKKIMNFNIRIVKNWYDVENVLKKNRYGGLEDAVDWDKHTKYNRWYN